MNVPAKWHLIPSNGLSRVHECDRQTYRWTDHATARRNRFLLCRLMMMMTTIIIIIIIIIIIAAAVLFGFKFADNIHYKFKNNQTSTARLQRSKHTGAKQNLTQNDHSRSFKITCFGVSGKAIRD